MWIMPTGEFRWRDQHVDKQTGPIEVDDRLGRELVIRELAVPCARPVPVVEPPRPPIAEHYDEPAEDDETDEELDPDSIPESEDEDPEADEDPDEADPEADAETEPSSPPKKTGRSRKRSRRS